MKVRNREQFIDISRGIAMICIVLGHLGCSNINRVVYTFDVPLFFFITGYFTRDKGTFSLFVKAKARSLLVPYFITSAVVVIAAALMTIVSKGNVAEAVMQWSYAAIYGAGDNYTEPFYIKGIGAIWFLWASFWGSVVLYISIKMKPAYRMLLIILSFVIGYYSRAIFWFPLSIQAGLCAALFMYIGYEMKNNRDALMHLSAEAKWEILLFSFAVWISFVRDFSSFWLVHCDIGRGVIDVFGCMCACHCVMNISRFIEYRMPAALKKGLAFLGRYSILMLCVHLIELDTFPWGRVFDLACDAGFPRDYMLYFLIIGKLVLIISAVAILSRIEIVRKVFAIR